MTRLIVFSELALVLKLDNYGRDLKEAAILDYYVAGYWYIYRVWYKTFLIHFPSRFAQETGFNEQQQSAFFTILYEMFEEMRSDSNISVGSAHQFITSRQRSECC